MKRKRTKYPKPKVTKRVVREAAAVALAPPGFKRTTLFMNGRSQAVRLPKEFRFEGTHVLIRKEGGRVILTSEDDRMKLFMEAYGSIPDFPDIDSLPHQERPELDDWANASA